MEIGRGMVKFREDLERVTVQRDIIVQETMGLLNR